MTTTISAPPALTEVTAALRLVGEVNGFAPPGDVHRIVDTGTETAISPHVYGTDRTRVGSGARRHYEPADVRGTR